MIETMKQALDALEAQGLKIDGSSQLAVKAKYKLRKAIAELESQEPVGWVKAHQGGVLHDINMPVAQKLPEGVRFDVFTHPPQRTWVGLTDEDVSDFVKQYWDDELMIMRSLIKAIEAYLKERNT